MLSGQKKPSPTQSLQDIFRKEYRWWFLGAVAICEIAYTYNLTSIVTLQVPLQKHFNLSEVEYSLIIAFASIPGVFVPVLAGLIADQHGSSIVFSFGMLINYSGQIISTYAIYIFSYWRLVTGQILLFSGYHAMLISKSKMIKNWFSRDEIATAGGVCMIAQITGVILCDVGYPKFYEAEKLLDYPYVFGCIIVLATAFFGVIQALFNYNLLFYQNVEKTHKIVPSFRLLGTLPWMYWVLVPFAVLGYISYFGTKIYVSKFFQITFGFSVGESGLLLAVALAISAAAMVLFGILLERYGKISLFALFGTLMVAAGVAGNLLLPKNKPRSFVVLPFVFASIGAMIVQIVSSAATARLVNQNLLDMALSFSGILRSVGMIVYPIITGNICQKTLADDGYFWIFVINAGLGILAAVFAVGLLALDICNDKVLVPSARNTTKSIRLLSNEQTSASMNDPYQYHEYIESNILINEKEGQLIIR